MSLKDYLVPKKAKPVVQVQEKRPVVHSHPLGQYLFANDCICNFAISGNGPYQRVVVDVLREMQGVFPVIILHGNDAGIMGISAAISQEKFGPDDRYFWVCGNGSFEPLLGIEEMELTKILQDLAKLAGYTCSSHFPKVVTGHLSLLEYMRCECSLSALYYLCSFKSLAKFQKNINMLDCSEAEKEELIWQLGLSSEANREQFDIFREVILRLAHESKISGWTPDQLVGKMNISTAIREKATLLLSVDSMCSPFLMQYLCWELKYHNHENFFLLIDDVPLKDSGISELLGLSSVGFRFGILSKNIVGMMDDKESKLELVAEKVHRLILFKHSMDTTAQTLADLIGKDYVERKTTTMGSDRGWLNITPDRKTKTIATTKEMIHRVETRDIINLEPNRAIIFDTLTNKIFRY